MEDQPVDYNTEVECLKKVEEDHVRIDTKHNIDVLKADVAKQLCKMKLLGITWTRWNLSILVKKVVWWPAPEDCRYSEQEYPNSKYFWAGCREHKSACLEIS